MDDSRLIKELNYLLYKDSYVSLRELNIILDEYGEEGDTDSKKYKLYMNNIYKAVERHNRDFIKRKLEEYKEYFDGMFVDVDNKIVLDEEQRKAILMDEDYSLIIAGAGSGKTTTMAAKVKYLVEKMNVEPKKIVLLAFTNKAADELATIINEEFRLNVEVLTFHKLGYRFLNKLFDKPLTIVSEYRSRELIIKFVKDIIFPNKEFLKFMMDNFAKYVHFEASVLEYDTFDEYYDSYVSNLYLKLVKEDALEKYILTRILNRENYNTSIRGEHLRSKGEVKIANFLYKNGFSYEYEKVYPEKIGKGSYHPDFTVDYAGNIFYIEYYGMASVNKDGKFSNDDINAYKKLIDKKRYLHKKYKTDLIEIYSEYEDEISPIDHLRDELKKRGFIFMPKTQKEIFDKIMYTSQETQYFKFIDLIEMFINMFKVNGYGEKDFEGLIAKENDEIVKHQLQMTKQIFVYYEYMIHKNYEVDFNDMINMAYKSLAEFRNKYRYVDYDYLIIDEYQDISKQRFNLAKSLSDIFLAKIVAVGDDWQSIYSFSGSEVNLFTNFYRMMGYAEISKITNTYRNSQELIDVAEEFVSKDESQFKKHLNSMKHLDKPIKIIEYDLDNEPDFAGIKLVSRSDAVYAAVAGIVGENKKGNILLLGRYNEDIEELLNEPKKRFIRKEKDRILCKGFNDVEIEFLTIHSSKGLGYDNVILLNAVNALKGFPSKMKDEPLLRVLKVDGVETIEYSEERRLFYVAMTRTKNYLYIVTPVYNGDKSEFITEISGNEGVEVLKYNKEWLDRQN